MVKMQSSSDEISVEEMDVLNTKEVTNIKSLKYLPRWPAVNIEFQDLSYSVPDLSGESIFYLFSIVEVFLLLSKLLNHYIVR